MVTTFITLPNEIRLEIFKQIGSARDAVSFKNMDKTNRTIITPSFFSKFYLSVQEEEVLYDFAEPIDLAVSLFTGAGISDGELLTYFHKLWVPGTPVREARHQRMALRLIQIGVTNEKDYATYDESPAAIECREKWRRMTGGFIVVGLNYNSDLDEYSPNPKVHLSNITEKLHSIFQSVWKDVFREGKSAEEAADRFHGTAMFTNLIDVCTWDLSRLLTSAVDFGAEDDDSDDETESDDDAPAPELPKVDYYEFCKAGGHHMVRNMLNDISMIRRAFDLLSAKAPMTEEESSDEEYFGSDTDEYEAEEFEEEDEEVVEVVEVMEDEGEYSGAEVDGNVGEDYGEDSGEDGDEEGDEGEEEE
ncbi:hypothetical protein BJ508DRAFT_331069 [Ascobolus immersus RN42]|uniref:Uncharacterized protein n=1 Tax=Ascobolus immersus RN42 TaxID=1160509 RepID=A0A3N4HRP4_ASCIM|nr:hypothetical protein BJ508DRAFT_331069 [Ascobolus immersus RN42]